MEKRTKKSYYELMDLSTGATAAEIEEAYKKAKGLYGEDSVAVYSLYSSDERREKLEELDEIYRTLSDPVKRRRYDESLDTKTGHERKTSKPSGPADWSALPGKEKDVFEEYSEVGAFKDRLSLKAPLAVTDSPDPMVSERYRLLYTKIEQAGVKNSAKSFCITSAVKNEGKTVTSVNLAYLMATEFNRKVLLVECDLKNPTISSSYFHLGRLYGLVDVMNGEVELPSAINRLEDTNLYVLPARCSVKNSSVLLDSPRMRSVLSGVKNEFDYIIVDAPPILPLVDVSILSKAVDGLIMVVRAGKTPKDLVKKAISSLPRQNLTGIVLNGAEETHMKKYYY